MIKIYSISHVTLETFIGVSDGDFDGIDNVSSLREFKDNLYVIHLHGYSPILGLYACFLIIPHRP